MHFFAIKHNKCVKVAYYYYYGLVTLLLVWCPITGIGFIQICTYWNDWNWVQSCCLFSSQPRLQQAEDEIEKLKKVEPLLRKELDTCQEVNLFLHGFVFQCA